MPDLSARAARARKRLTAAAVIASVSGKYMAFI